MSDPGKMEARGAEVGGPDASGGFELRRPAAGYDRIHPDAEGRVYSKVTGLLFSIDPSHKLVAMDAKRGTRLLISDEEEKRADKAEQRADEETAARLEAEQRADEEATARLEAERLAAELGRCAPDAHIRAAF